MHGYCTNALHTYKKIKSILKLLLRLLLLVLLLLKYFIKKIVVVVGVGKILLMTGRFAS